MNNDDDDDDISCKTVALLALVKIHTLNAK